MKKFKSMLCLVLLLCFTSTMLVVCKKSKSLTESMISLSQIEYVYDGTEKKPDVSVIIDGTAIDSSLYSVSYSDNTNAGQASVTVTATGKKNKNKTISGSVTVNYTIIGAELGEILQMSSKVYNGENQAPTVTIKNYTLGDDYTLSWEYKEIGADDSAYVAMTGTEFVNAGVYKVTATGTGNYAGEKTATYTINKATFTDLTSARDSYVYSTAKTDFVLSQEVISGVKYYYSTSDNFVEGTEFNKETELNVGKYYFYALVEESANYNSYKSQITSFEVTPFDVANLTVEFDKDAYDYTGNPVTPVPSVLNNGTSLVNDVDFTLSYSNNTYISEEAVVIITGKGNYTGTKNVTFAIKYSSKPCEKHTPMNPVVENIVKATLENDGSYEEVVRCEICGTEISRDEKPVTKVERSTIVIDTADVTYTGEEFKPSVTVENFVLDVDYTVSYENNVNAGNASVIVEFINEYYDIKITEHFTINKAVVTEPTIEGTFTYNGSEQTAIEVPADAKYSVSAENVQTNAGRYEVVVSLNNPENYVWETSQDSEDFTLEFVINKAVVTEPTIEGTFTYNGSEQTAIEVPADAKYSVSTENVQTNAGRYVITVSLNDKDNYVWETVGDSEDLSLEFIINKVVVTEPTIQNSFVYNGYVQHPAEPPADAPYFFHFNEISPNAGDYILTVYLKDFDNYVWANHPDESYFILGYEIKPLEIEEPSLENAEFTYNGQPHTPTLSYTNDAFEVGGDLSATDAGTYEIVVVLKSPINYIWANKQDSFELYFEYVIHKAEVEEPTIEGIFTYNGSEQTAIEVPENAKYSVSADNVQTNAGRYEVVVSLNDVDNYVWANRQDSEDFTLEFVINKAEVEEPTIEGTFTYNGSEQTAIEVPENAKYSVSADNVQTNAGRYEVVVSLNDVDNYIWANRQDSEDFTLEFVINKLDLSSAIVELSQYEYIYSGEAFLPTVTVTLNSIELVQDVDYVVEYTNNTNAGEAQVKITGVTNYEGKITENFTILKKRITEPEVTGTYIYNYNEQTAVLSYESDDFVVSNNKATNAGEYVVIVTLANKDNFIWDTNDNNVDLELPFIIEALDMSSAVITLDQTEFIYSGEAHEPNAVVVLDDVTLVSGDDYILTYIDNIRKGTAWAVVTGTNNFTGEARVMFLVGIKSIEMPTVVEQTYVYNGENQTFEFSGLNDYIAVSNSIQKNAGTYEVVVKLADKENCIWSATGNTDDFIFEFVIEKQKVEEPRIDGTYVYNKTEQTPTIVNTDDSSKYNLTTVSAINAGTYQVTASLKDTVNYAWSETNTSDSLVLDFVIEKVEVEEPRIEGIYEYNGQMQTAKLVPEDLTLYEVSNRQQTAIGSYDVKVSLIDDTNYVWKNSGNADDLILKFEIVGTNLESADVTLSKTSYVYTGTAFLPTVTVVLNGTTLKKDIDYSLTYENNKNVGTANVLVKGISNYYGEIICEFEITPYLVTEPVMSNITYTYDGKEQTVQFTNISDFFEISGHKQTNAGTYTAKAVLADKDNYVWSSTQGTEDLEFEYTIGKYLVTKPTKATPSLTYTYNGKEHEMTFNNVNDLMTITGNKQTNAGEYTVTISLNETSNYAWLDADVEDNIDDLTFSFVISKLVISNPVISGEYTYNGEPQTIITDSNNYTVTNGTNTDAGKYEVTVVLRDKDNTVWYSDKTAKDLTLSYVIKRADITKATYNWIQNYTYTGEAIEAEISDIKVNGMLLNINTDYTISYENNVEVGSATIVVTGIGNYTNTLEVAFNILAIKLTQDNITMSATGAEYTGENVMPTLTVNHNGLTLTENTDYSFTWTFEDVEVDEIVDSGEYILKFKGIGNYSADLIISFVVEKATYKDVTVVKPSYHYDNPSKVSHTGEIYGVIIYYYATDINATEWNYYSDDLILPVGKYYIYATVSETENHKAFETEKLEFEVFKAIRKDITISREDYSYGSPSDIVISGYDGTDYLTYYFIEGDTQENAVLFDATTVFNAGNYNIFVVIPESDSYEEYTSEISSFSVAKIDYPVQITLTRESYIYGQTKTPSVINGFDIDMNYVKLYYNLTESNKNGTLYTDSDDIDAGTYYIYAVIESYGNYNAYTTGVSELVISKGTYSGLTVIVNGTEYGNAVTPVLSVDDIQGEVTFLYSTIDINQSGNLYVSGAILNAGTYYMYAIISESNNYHAFITETTTMFVIETLKVEEPVISNKVYTGNVQLPLAENDNYTVSCNNPIDAGTYDVVVTLKDDVNYVWKNEGHSNALQLSYTIEKAPMSLVQASLSKDSYEFDGNAKTPDVTVYFNSYLVTASQYTVTYRDNISSGTAYAVVSANANSNFEGEIEIEFSIGKIDYTDVSVSRSNYSYLQPTDIIVNGIYEGNINFYYNLENTNEGGTLFTSDDMLDAGIYYFYAIIDESDNYNKFTTAVSVFTVYQANISTAVVEINGEDHLFTGEEIKPEITSITLSGIVVSADEFDITYDNNVNLGTASIIISAKADSNYTGSIVKTFTISNLDFTEAEVSFKDDITEFEYTGSTIKNSIELIVTLGGKTLVLDEDYTWNFATGTSSINVGTVNIEVTGKGNYSGTISVSCTIVPASLEDATVVFKNNGTTSYKRSYSGTNQMNTIKNYVQVTKNGKTLTTDHYNIVWTKDGNVVTSIKTAGTYIATITAKDGSNYVGEAVTTLTCTISPAIISDLSYVEFKPASLTANGTDLINTIKVRYDSTALTLGTDYTIVWKNAEGEVITEMIEAGTYTAEITILESGNYYYSDVITKTITVA